MENIRSTFLLCLSLGIFLLLLNHANAHYDTTSPWKNANLSPFEQWRSAYYCLQINTSAYCAPKDILTLQGWLSFENSTEAEHYCNSSCYSQTLGVINCIGLVHRHFKFATGASLYVLNNTIAEACNSPNKQGFNTSYKPDSNSATSLCGRLHLPIISTMALIIAIFTY